MAWYLAPAPPNPLPSSPTPPPTLPQSLAHVISSLRDLKAPPTATDAVLSVLRYALEAAVRQLSGHLEQLPAALASREGWVVSLTHSMEEAPVTHLPEQLQVGLLDFFDLGLEYLRSGFFGWVGIGVAF